ncbi:copper chaperone PCu(A)C [Anaerolinea thermolimosa]|nr:copper chaperone PCu(A)C [Anaerolinea thermolimosa]
MAATFQPLRSAMPPTFSRILALSLAILLILTACSPKNLQVTQPWARPGAAGDNSAIYLVIDNPTSEADTLLGAETDVAGSTELHRSSMENGMMMMEPQEKVSIDAKSRVVFEPGGLHVMLVGLKQDLHAGDTIRLTLNFEKAGAITLDVPVKEP